MKEFQATAGMNWISDLGNYLTHNANLNGEACAKIVRMWDYSTQQPTVEPRPTDTIIARKHGKGMRYIYNGLAIPSAQFVRVIAQLDRR